MMETKKLSIKLKLIQKIEQISMEMYLSINLKLSHWQSLIHLK